MKKTLLSAVLAGTIALTFGSIAAPSLAECPVNGPCDKDTRPAPPMHEFKKPLSPEEHAKMREQKKAEFEARLKLTEEQKSKLEKIKEDEKKSLAPYKEKIKKEQKKMEELFAKEREIRKQSMKKFESILTEEQKAELEKIKTEVKEEMDKIMPPMGPCGQKPGPKFGPKEPPKDAEGRPMCPPQCTCGCIEKMTKDGAFDDKCPCHDKEIK